MILLRHKAHRILVLFAAAFLAFGLSAFGSSANAHHALPVGFVESHRIFIRGTVTKYFLRNPHSFMFVEVVEEGGLPTEYKVEFAAAKSMKGKLGWSRTTFRKGDRVEVTGYPARNGFRLYGGALSRNGENTAIVHWLTNESIQEEHISMHEENLAGDYVVRKYLAADHHEHEEKSEQDEIQPVSD